MHSQYIQQRSTLFNRLNQINHAKQSPRIHGDQDLPMTTTDNRNPKVDDSGYDSGGN